MKRIFATAALAVLGSLPVAAQNRQIDFSPNGINYSQGRSWWQTLFGQPSIPVARADLNNTPRVNSLLRGGKLYLSLNDAIALALENNLDIAIQRENLPIADTDILRARAGSALRGVSTGLVTGTPGGTTSTATTGAGGTTGATGGGTGGTSTGQGGAGTGTGGLVSSTLGGGPAIPSFDPFLSSTLSIGSATTPESVTFLTGTNELVGHTSTANFTYNKGFSPGTQFSIGFTNQRQSSNNRNSTLNPLVNTGLTLTLVQPLLQGFGTAINDREIQIAKNNREISDIAFRQQVEFTVTQVESIYWGLVTAQDAVRVAQESVNLSQTVLNNNRRQVQIGTMAPIQVTQAQANLATSQQTLITAQTNYESQELLLKNAITKNLNDPIIAAADVVATDAIEVPATEPIEPIQDLIREALQYRPELAIQRINLTNQQITLRGVRNELLPQLNLVGSYGGAGLAGTFQCIPGTFSCQNPQQQQAQAAPFIGGYSRAFTNALPWRTYNNYSIGFQLQIPITNRSAQADVVRTQLEVKQTQLTQQQLQNQIEIQVRNAQYSLQQYHAAIIAARDAVQYNRENVDAVQKELNLGVATTTDLITAQTNLAQAESNLLTAQANYINARVTLNRLTGRTLQNDRISIIDAENGRVTQMPQAR